MKQTLPRAFLLVLFFGTFGLNAWCVNTWTQKANFSGSARADAVGLSLNGKGYVGTGSDGVNFLDDFWQYDPGTDAWTQKASVPGGGRSAAMGFVSATKCYIGTGQKGNNSSRDFYEYDPATNTWTQKADVGGPVRQGAAGVSLKENNPTKGYVFCGVSVLNFVNTLLNDFWSYNFATDTWTQKPNFIGSARSQCVGWANDTAAIVGTGYDGTAKADMYRYEQATNSWFQIASFPGGACWGASIFRTTAGVGVGLGFGGGNPSDFWFLNGYTLQWSQVTSVGGPARSFGAAFGIGDKGYCVSGFTTFLIPNVTYPGTWEFDDRDINANWANPGFICAGYNAPTIVSWTLSPGTTMQPGNMFTAQMSDAIGSFANPTTIGTAFGVTSGTMTSYIPPVPVGFNYRVRVISNMPPVTGNSTGNSMYVAQYVGQPCDDNDPCTVSDVLGPNCLCAGTYLDSDNDGTCDALDGCPFDPNLIAPATWYTDVDGDGYGDPSNSLVSCTQFFGYVNNALDNCPNIFGLMGDPCNDNIPCTVNDMIDANCNCTGIAPDSDGDGFPDCLDNCPYTFGQMGSPCNDNNPFTSNDVVDPNCVCVGTCNGAPITLTLTTDINGAQTTWNIVIGGTNTIVCSGFGFFNSSTITVNCCLANGCYDLRVYDSFGDGINPGGYVLTDAASNRIIDNSNNGPNFSTLSEVLDVTSTPVSFCVPTGTDALVPASCDQTGLTINSVIQSQINANVSAQYGITNATSGYQFWIFGPNATYSRRLFQSHAAPGNGWPLATPVAQRAAYLKLNTMNNAPIIPSNVLLNVRVRSRVAGVYGAFGPACRLTIGNVINCSTTQLTTTPTPLVSCGAIGLNRLFGVIWSNNVPLANKYQFEFVNANTLVFLRNISSPTRNLNMTTWGNAIALPNCFTPYNIRVRVSFNNGATYCPWGPACQVSFTCPPENGRRMESTIADHGTINIWPNPNDGKQLAIALSSLDANTDHIDLVIFDAFGKEVMAHLYPASNGEVNAMIGFDHALAAGVYVVRITSGEQQFTQRLIIE